MPVKNRVEASFEVGQQLYRVELANGVLFLHQRVEPSRDDRTPWRNTAVGEDADTERRNLELSNHLDLRPIYCSSSQKKSLCTHSVACFKYESIPFVTYPAIFRGGHVACLHSRITDEANSCS